MTKRFKFKNEYYDIHKLIILNSDVSIKEYQSGIVIDTINKQEYDINQLFDFYNQEVINLLNSNTLDEQTHKILQRIFNQRLKQIDLTSIYSKIENNTIKFYELEHLLNTLAKTERNSFGVPRYRQYQILNNEATKPKEITKNDHSSFMLLANKINYKNQITYPNGKPITKKDLLEILEFDSIRSLNRCLLKLQQVNMIKIIKFRKHKYIVVNPIYTMKHIQIDVIPYHIFKTDMQQFLNLIEIKYMDMLADAFFQNKDNILDIMDI